eukprot:RCo032944
MRSDPTQKLRKRKRKKIVPSQFGAKQLYPIGNSNNPTFRHPTSHFKRSSIPTIHQSLPEPRSSPTASHATTRGHNCPGIRDTPPEVGRMFAQAIRVPLTPWKTTERPPMKCGLVGSRLSVGSEKKAGPKVPAVLPGIMPYFPLRSPTS